MSGIIFIGGFHELEEICNLSGVDVIGAIDNAPSARSNAPYLGSDDDADAVFKKNPAAVIHISPDKPQLRQKLWNKFAASNARTVQTLIHPTALISKSTKIGEGCAIHMGVVISSANSIGKGVKINTGVAITHDVIIEDFVTVAPRAVICSAATIETGVYIGANATIMPGVRIGANAVIGAGAVVTRDVDSGATVYGNPAIAKGHQA